MTSETPIILRPAQPTDAGKIGHILHCFQRDTPWMPMLHTGAEDIAFCGKMIDRGWVTVAVQGLIVLGFVARDGAEICSLYLAPGACGQGLGLRLLNHAKEAVGTEGKLTLFTFEQNTGAQKFYLREGFSEIGRSGGARNAERLPDIEYHWSAMPAKAAQK